MSDDQNRSTNERKPDTEVVFNESYEGEEVESLDITRESFTDPYEDEDELDRIPLEQEPDLEEVMEEIRQEREGTKLPSGTVAAELGAKNGAKKENPQYGLGLTAMILGILSILIFCVPPVGLVLATVALILGIVAAARNNGKKMGISGIIMGVIVLLTYLVIFMFFDGVFGMLSRNQDRLTGTAWRRTTDGSVLYLYKDGTFIDVEQEGVFTDNFYSGTYDILAYEETGLDFTGLEGQYNMDYAYDVYLYVNLYVSNGEEREDIAGTMRYLYLFERNYETGDAVDVCAHDSAQYGTVFPVKGTDMAYPVIGNQYMEGIGTEESETSEAVEAEPESTEGEPVSTEVEPESTEVEPESTEAGDTGTTDTEVESMEPEQGTTADLDSFWGGIDDFIQDSKEEIEDFNASVSEEIDKNSESISSAVEEAGSMVEEASSAAEELEQIADESGIWKFFQNIFQWIRDLFS